MPAGTSFVSADGGGLEAAGTVTWNLGTLADGASATVHVTVHVDEAAPPTCPTPRPWPPTPDPDGSDDAATEPPPSMRRPTSRSRSPTRADPVVAGQDLTYTLTVTNDGPSDATNVVVSDPVPAGTSSSRPTAAALEAAGTVTWNLGHPRRRRPPRRAP